ncbi:Uncharacterized protein Fot_26358 [Forsythia ovata]|uniref:Uncharacterized protein n=1 Tax=Forsythia ovata TaxID=205694 RepID=A0ABD1UBM8_9LAMI
MSEDDVNSFIIGIYLFMVSLLLYLIASTSPSFKDFVLFSSLNYVSSGCVLTRASLESQSTLTLVDGDANMVKCGRVTGIFFDPLWENVEKYTGDEICKQKSRELLEKMNLPKGVQDPSSEKILFGTPTGISRTFPMLAFEEEDKKVKN